MSRVLRVACFGAGWVTTNRHVPAMRAHPGYEVVAIVDGELTRARSAAAALGVPLALEASSVTDLDILDEIDAITCGTAPFSHYAVVKSGLEAGKHVITEKPFTMTVAEGEELVALADERKVVLAVVHNFQFARSVTKLLGWIADGRLGEVRGFWAVQLSNPRRRLPTWFDDLPLGLFYDEAPHLIYLTRALAGELSPRSVTVHPSTMGTNTPAQIDVQMTSLGRPVSMQMNFEAPLSEWHVAVLGEKGMGIVDIFRDIAIHVPNDGGHLARDVIASSASSTWHHWLGYIRSGFGHLRGTLRYGNDEVFDRFHHAVATGSRPAGIDARDALDVLRIQHWIIES